MGAGQLSAFKKKFWTLCKITELISKDSVNPSHFSVLHKHFCKVMQQSPICLGGGGGGIV